MDQVKGKAAQDGEGEAEDVPRSDGFPQTQDIRAFSSPESLAQAKFRGEAI